MVYNRGQIAVIITMIIAKLMGAAALGTDVALNYYNRLQMQKAADGGVLAGANYLPNDPADAQSVAKSYGTENGLLASEITSTTVASDGMSVTLVASRTVPYLFARVLGLNNSQVTVTATAGIQSNAQNARGLLPIGLPCAQGNCKYIVGKWPAPRKLRRNDVESVA
jgi:uncharacterized membrane protein